MKGRYTPDGITAMARQHPLLKREESDLAALAAAEKKRRRKAEAKMTSGPVGAPGQTGATGYPGQEKWATGAPGPAGVVIPRFGTRAEQRRLLKRAKK